MSKQIELQINRFLSQFGELDFAADQILKAIDRQSLGRLDVYAVSSFLYQAGFYRAYISFVQKCLEKDRAISWQFIAELSRLMQNPDPRFVKSVYIGADANADLDILAQSHAFDHVESRLPAIRKHQRTLEQSNYQKERQNLLDQIRVFREQDKLDLELELILKLQRAFPRDPEVSKQYNLYLERKARSYLSKRKAELPLIFRDDQENDPQIIEILFSEIQTRLAENNESALDYAMLFVFMEEYEKALRIAEKAPESESRNWLIAELMISAEKYAEALDWILILETQYQNSTETPFAVSYLRALAYYGLSQVEAAVAVLEGLIHTRPNYRLAETLYRQWCEELA